MPSQDSMSNFMQGLLRRSELFLPLVLVLIVVMMVIPVPPMAINFLIALSLTIALISILITLYVKEPLEFSVFPTVILIATIFRLAINITTTRSILSRADAGEIVQAFGTVVTGGSYVVGAVIFLIIVLVNYVVITHGAQRIGEVAARFTLDAMPGKQMSIDADLNNGLINEEEARERRRKIEQEADYFGAMDGASRFVQRDALAGLIITLINIGAGFVVGMISLKMTALESIKIYTMLTIGDGLVSSLPALLMSTATGIMVTKSGTRESLSADYLRQMLSHPKALMSAGAILGMFATLCLLIGDWRIFLSVGLVAGAVYALGAYYLKAGEEALFPVLGAAPGAAAAPGKRKPGAIGGAGMETPAMGGSPARATENVANLLHIDPMELEIGYGLIPLVDPEQKGDLLDRVTMIRRQTALEMGVVVPPIRIRDNIQLRPNEYTIKIKGTEVAHDALMMDHYLAMNPGTVTTDVEGVDTTEPAFGLPAKWIRENRKEQAEMLGYTVVDPASVVATHLTEVIKNNAHELLGRQETQSLIDLVKEKSPAVVEELIPNKLGLGEVQKVLQNLLRERVSIRNLASILETLADYSSVTKDIGVLTEYARTGLSRQISKQYVMPDGAIPVITLAPALEDLILDSVQQSAGGTYPILEPAAVRRINNSLATVVEKAVQLNYQPVVLCSPRVRMYVRRLFEKTHPNLVILSHSEIDPGIRIRSIGMVALEGIGAGSSVGAG